MYEEEDLLPLSALQHFVFCQRQCALIHIEQIWMENLFTAEGRIMHDKVHNEGTESRGNIKIVRDVALRSLELGLSGKADVVEFHKKDDGSMIPFPVEYKRGKPKSDNCDKVQLCAQALCLEEMLNVEILKGALFYGKTRHRFDVEFDEHLRSETKETVNRLHEFIKQGITPKPSYTEKCESCSLLNICLPKTIEHIKSVQEYFKREIEFT